MLHARLRDDEYRTALDGGIRPKQFFQNGKIDGLDEVVIEAGFRRAAAQIVGVREEYGFARGDGVAKRADPLGIET